MRVGPFGRPELVAPCQFRLGIRRVELRPYVRWMLNTEAEPARRIHHTRKDVVAPTCDAYRSPMQARDSRDVYGPLWLVRHAPEYPFTTGTLYAYADPLTADGESNRSA